MLHFDTLENMQQFIFGESCFTEPDFFCKTDPDEFNCALPVTLSHADSFRFMDRIWSDKNSVMSGDDSFMCFSDCSKAPCFVKPDFDSGLYENHHGMEFFDENILKLEINQLSASENELSTISNPYLQKTTGYFKGGCNVGLDCFDDICEDNSLLWKDTQEYRGRINEAYNTVFNSVPVVSHFQKRLQAKDTELFVPFFDNEDVSKRLEEMLENKNTRATSSCEHNHEIDCSRCSFYEVINEKSCVEGDSYNSQNVKRSIFKRKYEGKKDERYWTRRMKNNAAAKKSRAARKNRFSSLEKRIKELEIENAEKKEFLRILEQKLLEKQRK